MANSVSATSGSSAPAPVQSKDNTKDASGVSPLIKAKSDLNASIIQATLTVSIDSSNEPMSLLLKTALTGINEQLQGEYGDNAIQNAMSQDNSPEATANRIVSLSTGFYESFKKQHVGEDEGEVLNKFIDTLQKGVDQGFKEARGILDGLKALNGGVSSNIDKTYDLVKQGYADFITANKPKPAEETQPEAVTKK